MCVYGCKENSRDDTGQIKPQARSNLRPDEPSKINSQDYVFILDSAISKQRTQGLPSIDRRYIEAMDFFWFLSIAYEVVLLQLT